MAGAEYYRYIDENGNVSFTDNIMNVPEDQRQNMQIIETPADHPDADLKENNAAESDNRRVQRRRLSPGDMRSGIPDLGSAPWQSSNSPDQETSPDQRQKANGDKKTAKDIALPGLSQGDLEFINELKEAGVINDGDLEAVSPEHIPEYIEYLKKMLKELYGVDENEIRKKDPRFSSPEKTWSQHKEALMRGDIDAAIECFIPSSAKQYGEIYRAMGREQMKQIAAEMTPIEKIIQEKNYAEYRIRRKENGRNITYDIYFSNIFGNWEIDRY